MKGNGIKKIIYILQNQKKAVHEGHAVVFFINISFCANVRPKLVLKMMDPQNSEPIGVAVLENLKNQRYWKQVGLNFKSLEFKSSYFNMLRHC